MKQYTTYIFDLDGTITDTATVWLDIFREGLSHFGVTPPDDRTLANHTHDWNQMLELGLDEKDLNSFIALAHNLATKRLPEAPLHVDALETLEALRNSGRRVAIYSGMDRAIFEPAIKRHNLDVLMEATIAGDDAPRRKPYADGIMLTLQKLGIGPGQYQQVVYMGDKDTDILAAQNAGIDSILYYPIAHQLMYDLEELKKHKPTEVITDWHELSTDNS